MDEEPPTRHPCTCDELHQAPSRECPKYVGMPLPGSFGMHAPMTGIAVYLWDSCPQHGGYLVAGSYEEMGQLHPELWTKYRQTFQMNRYWAYEPRGGYAHGTEPPWEPTYCMPVDENGMVAVEYEALPPQSAPRMHKRLGKKVTWDDVNLTRELHGTRIRS